MKSLFVTIMLLLFLAPPCFAAAPNHAKLRPYTGIGVLVLSVAPGVEGERPEPLYLYHEPAISRLGELNSGTVPPYEWVFGMSSMKLLLIVTSRKGNWLRVVYDDAGREGWLMVQRQGAFQPWESFFKGQSARLLPGLHKQFYQLYQQPGSGHVSQLGPKKGFKIIKLEEDWALVMPDMNSLGWLRWRDEDGRLLIGLERVITIHKQM
ncbi:MAG: hypothetical protein CXR30_03785 [Geobacter sp.]|nr:MAG: hypothetical protein CXR30_03785 [Geobacter sp.]